MPIQMTPQELLAKYALKALEVDYLADENQKLKEKLAQYEQEATPDEQDKTE